MTTTPTRITRRRTKGWRMPAGAVYVGRPSKWGNPYELDDPAEAVRLYRAHALDLLQQRPNGLRAQLEQLRGKTLACWCKAGQPCHADVLLELANKETTP